MRRAQGGAGLVANETALLRIIDEMHAAGPVYGYQVLQRIDADHSTVYRCLNRLAAGGLLERTVTASPAGPPRVLYDLTDAGREQLAAPQSDRRASTLRSGARTPTTTGARSEAAPAPGGQPSRHCPSCGTPINPGTGECRCSD